MRTRDRIELPSWAYDGKSDVIRSGPPVRIEFLSKDGVPVRAEMSYSAEKRGFFVFKRIVTVLRLKLKKTDSDFDRLVYDRLKAQRVKVIKTKDFIETRTSSGTAFEGLVDELGRYIESSALAPFFYARSSVNRLDFNMKDSVQFSADLVTMSPKESHLPPRFQFEAKKRDDPLGEEIESRLTGLKFEF